MNSGFNSDRFLASIKMISDIAVTDEDIPDLVSAYSRVNKRAAALFGDQYEDVHRSISTIADAVISVQNVDKRLTILVELIVMVFYLEEIIEQLHGWNENREKNSFVSDGEGVRGNEVGGEQGGVRHRGGRKAKGKAYTV